LLLYLFKDGKGIHYPGNYKIVYHGFIYLLHLKMFTGIIECMGKVVSVAEKGSNRVFSIESAISAQLKEDQSVSHNGICLTVEQVSGNQHQVTAIDETLKKTDAGYWQPGRELNLERCVAANGRFDGHFVSGHIDGTGICTSVEPQNGSTICRFSFEEAFAPLVIEKGGIGLNGISLTIFDVSRTGFAVAIIPYTWEHTTLRHVQPGDTVNLEFDMIGKYINRRFSLEKGIIH
jgi:riboflavin synthase